MKNPFIGTVAILLFSLIANAAEFDAPESVVYHQASDSYYVSNFGGDNVVRVDAKGKTSSFIPELTKPLGLVLHEKTLYVVNNSKFIKGFRLADAKLVFELEISEAAFLNDVAVDAHGDLYVSDSKGAVIYKVDRRKQAYSRFTKSKFPHPNGIYYDDDKERVIVCQFDENASIELIPVGKPAQSTLIKTSLFNLDGIARDERGNFYISAWDKGDFDKGYPKTGAIYKFDQTFSNPPEPVVTGLHGPADITYIKEAAELAIPLFFEQRIAFEAISN